MVNLRKLRDRMKQKDLAGEYLTKAQENAIYFKDGKFPNMPLYQENDIKAAFNAGRESAVENMPELDWKGLENFQYADTCFGRYNIDNFVVQLLRFNGKEIPTPADCSLEEAQQAANEYYKQRIKQALGL